MFFYPLKIFGPIIVLPNSIIVKKYGKENVWNYTNRSRNYRVNYSRRVFYERWKRDAQF